MLRDRHVDTQGVPQPRSNTTANLQVRRYSHGQLYNYSHNKSVVMHTSTSVHTRDAHFHKTPALVRSECEARPIMSASLTVTDSRQADYCRSQLQSRDSCTGSVAATDTRTAAQQLVHSTGGTKAHRLTEIQNGSQTAHKSSQ